MLLVIEQELELSASTIVLRQEQQDLAVQVDRFCRAFQVLLLDACQAELERSELFIGGRPKVDAALQHVAEVCELAEVLIQTLERAVGVDFIVAPIRDDLRVAIDGFRRLFGSFSVSAAM